MVSNWGYLSSQKVSKDRRTSTFVLRRFKTQVETRQTEGGGRRLVLHSFTGSEYRSTRTPTDCGGPRRLEGLPVVDTGPGNRGL